MVTVESISNHNIANQSSGNHNLPNTEICGEVKPINEIPSEAWTAHPSRAPEFSPCL